jgi:hypothetical protein
MHVRALSPNYYSVAVHHPDEAHQVHARVNDCCLDDARSQDDIALDQIPPRANLTCTSATLVNTPRVLDSTTQPWLQMAAGTMPTGVGCHTGGLLRWMRHSHTRPLPRLSPSRRVSNSASLAHRAWATLSHLTLSRQLITSRYNTFSYRRASHSTLYLEPGPTESGEQGSGYLERRDRGTVNGTTPT